MTRKEKVEEVVSDIGIEQKIENKKEVCSLNS